MLLILGLLLLMAANTKKLIIGLKLITLLMNHKQLQ